MNKGDVFILDDGCNVFCWNGSQSSKVQRVKVCLHHTFDPNYLEIDSISPVEWLPYNIFTCKQNCTVAIACTLFLFFICYSPFFSGKIVKIAPFNYHFQHPSELLTRL